MEGLLSTLPQGKHIPEDVAQRWLKGVANWHADRAAWHVQRLKGIGGSEIGAVIRGVNDLPGSGFHTLPEIVEMKLMRRLPSRQNSHMERGTVLEELAALAFMIRYKAARDVGALQAVGNTPPRPGYEWLVGNPDDFVLLANKRFLVDYKVQSTYTDEIAFDYEAQLHHYGLQARMSKVKLDGYMLVKLDLAPELAASLVQKFPTMTNAEKYDLAKMIAVTDVPGMRVVALGVEHRKELDVDLLSAGRYAWDEFVMKGVVPEMKLPEAIMNERDIGELASLQQQFAMAKAGVSHLNDIASQATERMKQLVSGIDLDKASLPVGIVNVKPAGFDNNRMIEEAIALGATPEDLASNTPAYSVTALIDEIKRLNGDPEARHLFDSSPQADRAKSYLEQVEGLDLTQFRKPGISVALSRKKADQALQNALIDEAAAVVTPWFERQIADLYEDQLEELSPDVVMGECQDLIPGAHTAADHEDENLTHTPMTKSATMR